MPCYYRRSKDLQLIQTKRIELQADLFVHRVKKNLSNILLIHKETRESSSSSSEEADNLTHATEEENYNNLEDSKKLESALWEEFDDVAEEPKKLRM
ncbi:hypothetical protein CEXT_358381 [Caerostris extrusa]|uniref:Uncharacterized protein n=1 Tax=Caerostris extrusa TaxID=172846 RepID=A0AAV4NHY2_CAEEX|nr:hypothetical protein CEXT_358381 [Caerostris extrusa]